MNILIICYIPPTHKHAGGVRIIDIIRMIKSKYPKAYVELFTSENIDMYGSLEEAYRIVDQIVISQFSDFSLLEYLRLSPRVRYFDVIDFQFLPVSAIIKPYREIGRKLTFTPMESQIRNECINRGLEIIRFNDLNSRNAIEEANICRLVDQVVCVSENDRSAIDGCVEANLIVIETAVSEIDYRDEPNMIPSRDNTVCYIAYFGSKTNKEALRWYIKEVHDLVKSAVPDYVFWIIGRGDVSGIIKGAPAGITYFGEVEQVVPYIKASTIGIAPAISGSGFRGKINQYSAENVPTVASRLAADGLKYEHGHSIMIADNPSEFANSVIFLLQNSDARRSIGCAAAEVCQLSYRWETRWPMIACVYDLPLDPNAL